MVRQELKKLVIYGFFLLIIITPMVGFKNNDFDLARVLQTLAVLIGILVLNLIVKLVRSKRPQRAPGHQAWSERIRDRIEQFPKIYTLGGLVLITAMFPLFADNYMIDVAITCLIYITLGLGLNIVVGLCGLLDLGYIAFYAVGAYTYSLLNLKFGLSFWAAMPIGVILGMTCGCIIGYPTLKMRGDYLAIVTMGFGYYPTFQEGGLSWMAYNIKSLPSLYYFIYIIVILTIIGVRRLDNSRVGRAWVAIREDETAAELSGVPTTWIKLLAYALGAGFASVAGAFFAAKLSYTNPNFFLFMESCIVLCIVVLGGVGSIPGIIVAGIVLIAAPEIFRGLESYRMLAFGGIMTVMMVIKPEGLIPARRHKRNILES